MRQKVLRVLQIGTLCGLLLGSVGHAQTLSVPSNPVQEGESVVASSSDLAIWDTATLRIHDNTNVIWETTTPLAGAASVDVRIDDPSLELGGLVYSMDTIDGEQSMLVELLVDANGIQSYTMVPMDWDRASEWEIRATGLSSSPYLQQHYCSTFAITRRGSWGEFWSGYWYYLTHPSEMDDDLETGFYVSGGIGVGAGVLAGGIVAAPVVAGSTFTIPTITVTTTTTGGITGGGLILGGTATTVTTGTVTISGTTVVAGTAVLGGTTVLMSVDPNKLHHIFEKPAHNLGGFVRGHGGDKQAAFEAVRKAIQALIDSTGQKSGVIKDVVVNVGGKDITVRSVVIDGIVRIGTFFIP